MAVRRSYKLTLQKLIFCVLYLRAATGKSSYLSRNERALVYPPFTVLQFAAGLAVPAQVPNRTIFTNLGTLSNIPLPSKVNQLYPYAKRNGRHRIFTHSHVFKFFEKVLFFDDSSEQCLQKTICQMAQSKFKKEDLITKLLHELFSLSHIKYAVSEKRYFIAEQNGRMKNISCSQIYPSCHSSILDFVSYST